MHPTESTIFWAGIYISPLVWIFFCISALFSKYVYPVEFVSHAASALATSVCAYMICVYFFSTFAFGLVRPVEALLLFLPSTHKVIITINPPRNTHHRQVFDCGSSAAHSDDGQLYRLLEVPVGCVADAN